MAEITAQVVNEFRKVTGLGLMKCKELLTQAGSGIYKALPLAKEQGIKDAGKRSGRTTSAGRVEVYIHHDFKSGAMVEVNCETDFVARNEEFKQFTKDLAVHIMAASPLCVRREELDPAAVAEQKRIFLTQSADKPEQIREKIADGKLQSWYSESVLLDQEWIKDSSDPNAGRKRRVSEVVTDLNARTGENITIARFARFVVGDSKNTLAEAAAAQG